MSYVTGGNVQASDYNTFATLIGGMNEVFADSHSGATTISGGADYGYGQTPPLTAVSAASNIQAAEWANLFTVMKDCGTFQGTTTVPPLPVTNPSPGNNVTAYNTPSALASVVTNLRTNRHNVALGQYSVITGTNYSQTGGSTPWTNSLTWNFQVDFGSWNNARYFFNSGGELRLSGSYAPVVTPEDIQWDAMLSAMSPLVFDWNSTTPNSGTGGTALGFYDLTTSYQTLYQKTYGGGGYYSTSYILFQGKYNAAAGTSGIVDFNIALVDGDISPNSKTSITTYHVDRKVASGTIVYPGSYSMAPVGVDNGFVAT